MAGGTRIPATTALLQSWVDAAECLGGQVFVWQDGEIVADLALGRSGPARAASGDDVSRLFCAVKPVAACVLARAVTAGEATFDDPVWRFLPEFHSSGRDRITLRQLLSHTSGLPDLYADPYADSFPDRLRRAYRVPLPVSSWYHDPFYNDTFTWHILGDVVERIFGADFADVVATAVAEPAGAPGLRMVDPEPSRYVPHLAVRNGDFVPLGEPSQDALFGRANPAHGGFGSARDLGLLYAELVRCAGGAGTLLGPEPTRELTRDHGPVTFGLGVGRRPVGLGFLVDIGQDTIGGSWSRRSFGHPGFISRYRVVYGFGDPEYRVAVAIRLFSVGAKNNWRFHRLGAAVWSDLSIRETGG